MQAELHAVDTAIRANMLIFIAKISVYFVSMSRWGRRLCIAVYCVAVHCICGALSWPPAGGSSARGRGPLTGTARSAATHHKCLAPGRRPRRRAQALPHAPPTHQLRLCLRPPPQRDARRGGAQPGGRGQPGAAAHRGAQGGKGAEACSVSSRAQLSAVVCLRAPWFCVRRPPGGARRRPLSRSRCRGARRGAPAPRPAPGLAPARPLPHRASATHPPPQNP